MQSGVRDIHGCAWSRSGGNLWWRGMVGGERRCWVVISRQNSSSGPPSLASPAIGRSGFSCQWHMPYAPWGVWGVAIPAGHIFTAPLRHVPRAKHAGCTAAHF